MNWSHLLFTNPAALSVDLLDVSPVAAPAYTSTTVEIRTDNRTVRELGESKFRMAKLEEINRERLAPHRREAALREMRLQSMQIHSIRTD